MDAPRFSPIQNDNQTRPGFPGQSNSLSQQLEQLFGLIRRQHLLIVVIIASTMALGFSLFEDHAADLCGTRQAHHRQQ